jgi:glycosyltransferase involved in cell wall biosynthesis
MKHVLIVIKGLGRGGSERIVANATSLGSHERFRYEVAYMLPSKNALVAELADAGVDTTCIGSDVLWPIRLRRLVEERDVDLVHVHSPVAASIIRLTLRNRPIVYTEHNVWQRYVPLTRLLNAATYRLNDHVFAVSNDVLASVRASSWGRRCTRAEVLVHGLPPGRLTDSNPAADIRESLGVSPIAPLVCTVANFKPYKGHENLLRAVCHVRKARPDTRFVLVGVGATEQHMKDLASELGLSDLVRFAGLRDDALDVMAASDLFVLPSEKEGLPIALLEAMRLGKPVVATSVGGIPEVISDRVDGVLVSPREPQHLANAIVWLLDDEHERTRLGRRAERRAADFDIRTAIERMEQVYEELVA